MKISNIEVKPLRDLQLRDNIANAQDIIARINLLDNRLSGLTLESAMSIQQITFLLKEIVLAFGGNAKIKFTLNLTADDMQNEKNFIYFLPFVSVCPTINVDWGDQTSNVYGKLDIISHIYNQAGEYQICINSDSDDISLNVHRQSDEPVKLTNDFDNTISQDFKSTTILDNIDANGNVQTQQLDSKIISKQILDNTPINVLFGSSLEKIEDGCFKDNDKLFQISFDKMVNIESNFTVGNEAFANCTSFLGNICLPDTCTSIGDDAFANCYNIYSITIPKSCTHIGKGAFYNCKSLQYLTFKGRTTEEVQQFIDDNIVDSYVSWFSQNNIQKMQYDFSIDDIVANAYSQFVESLPLDTSDIAKSMLFRKHIFTDLLQSYDFSSQAFCFLKYLANTTPEHINLHDYQKLVYSLDIVNTILHEQSNDNTYFSAIRLMKADGSSVEENYRRCSGGQDNRCDDFRCATEFNCVNGSFNTCKTKNYCSSRYTCDIHRCLKDNLCGDGVAGTGNICYKTHYCYSKNGCNDCVNGFFNKRDLPCDIACTNFIDPYNPPNGPIDPNNIGDGWFNPIDGTITDGPTIVC